MEEVEILTLSSQASKVDVPTKAPDHIWHHATVGNGGGNESLLKSHFATNSANKFNIFITDTNVIPLN